MTSQPPDSAAAEAPSRPRWGAFSYPNYRRYWISMVARVFGLQFRFIGTSWLVFVELDRSPIWLGVVGLASALPTIVLSVPAGIVADRFDTRRILVISQVATAQLTFLMATLVVAGQIDIWLVIAWNIAVGALAALANPAQAAILPRLIDMSAMASAVAFTSSVWNTMRIVGPAGAGVMIALIGTGQAFFITAGGFAVSAFLLATLSLTPLQRDENADDGGMFEGVRYIFSNRIFLATIGLSFFTSVFGSSYQTLLAVFADDILAVGSSGFGLLEAAAGVGGFLGTLAIIKVGAGRYAGVIMLAAAAFFGIFVAGFAGSRSFPLSMVLLFAAGFTSSMYLNIGMTTLQLLVPDALRGRVMGVWSMTWFLASVGGLPAGIFAELIGTPLTVALGALSVSAFAVLLLVLSSELRRLPQAVPLGAAQRS
jgi:MFS family permease